MRAEKECARLNATAAANEAELKRQVRVCVRACAWLVGWDGQICLGAWYFCRIFFKISFA